MDSIDDPLEPNETLKSATIYRNGAYNYIYVCYHCECSFLNISDTLNHVETHFDVKVNIVDDNLIVYEPEVYDTKDKSEIDVLESDNQINEIDETNGNTTPVTNNIIFPPKFESQEHYEEDFNVGFSEQSYHHSQCSLCQIMCHTTAQLIIHLLKVHVGMVTLTCPACSQNWTSETDTKFEGHLQQHITDGDTTYDILIQKLISECEVMIKSVVGEGSKFVMQDQIVGLKCKPKSTKKCFTCDICLSTFTTKQSLKSHMKQQHIVQKIEVIQKYDCEKCDRQIEGKFLFYAHQYGHLTDDETVNELDDDVLRQNLRKFLDETADCDKTTPNNAFSCKLCRHLSVKRRRSIDYHILQEHIYRLKNSKNTDKRFPCEYCGRKFAINHNLVVHRRTHTQEKPYTCLICNKSFALSSYMKYHERVHSGIRPHQCSTCGLSFKSNSKLNFHHKVHTNNTTKCEICNKELKSHRLKIHIRNVHHNEHRPYKCTVCLQGFKTAKTLKIHSYRHSGEKNYECRFHCKQKFVSSAGRRAHERSKHEAP